MKKIRIILINVLAVVLGVSLVLFTACANRSDNNNDGNVSGFFTGDANIYSLLDNYTINDKDTLAFDGLTLDLCGKTLNLNNKMFAAKSTSSNNVVISNGTITNGEVILGSKEGQVQLDNITFDDSVSSVKIFGNVVVTNTNFGQVELIQVEYEGTNFTQSKEVNEESINLSDVTISKEVSIGRLTISAPVNAQINGFVADVVFEEEANYSYFEATQNSNIGNIYVGAKNVFLNIDDNSFVNNIFANDYEICLSTCAPEQYVECVPEEVYEGYIEGLKEYTFVSCKPATCEENGYVKFSYVNDGNNVNTKFITKASHVYGEAVKVPTRYDFWKVNEYVCEACGHKTKTVGDTTLSIDDCDNFLDLLTIWIPDFNYDFNLDAGTQFGNLVIQGGYVHVVAKNGKFSGTVVAKVAVDDNSENDILFKGYIKGQEVYLYGVNIPEVELLHKHLDITEEPIKINLYNLICTAIQQYGELGSDVNVEKIGQQIFETLKSVYNAMNTLATAQYDVEYLIDQLGEDLYSLVPVALWENELSTIKFFDIEEKANSTIYTLTFDKLYSEIDKLVNLTIRELIDISYPVEIGETKTSELVYNFLLKVPSITVNDFVDYVVDFAERSGVGKDRLFGIINDVLEAALGEEMFDNFFRGDIRTILESQMGYITINDIVRDMTYKPGDNPEDDEYVDLSKILVKKNINYILDSTIKEFSDLAKDEIGIDPIGDLLEGIKEAKKNIVFSYELDKKDSVLALDLGLFETFSVNYDATFDYSEVDDEEVKTITSQVLDINNDYLRYCGVDEETIKYKDELKTEPTSYVWEEEHVYDNIHFEYLLDENSNLGYIKSAYYTTQTSTITQEYNVVKEIDYYREKVDDIVSSLPSPVDGDVVKIFNLECDVIEINNENVVVVNELDINLDDCVVFDYTSTYDNKEYTGFTFNAEYFDLISIQTIGTYNKAVDFTSITGTVNFEGMRLASGDLLIGSVEFGYNYDTSKVDAENVIGLINLTVKYDTYKEAKPTELPVIFTLSQQAGKDTILDEFGEYTEVDYALTNITFNFEGHGVITLSQTQGYQTVDIYEDGEVVDTKNIVVVLSDIKQVDGGYVIELKQYNNEVAQPTEDSNYAVMYSFVRTLLGEDYNVTNINIENETSNSLIDRYHFDFYQTYEEGVVLSHANILTRNKVDEESEEKRDSRLEIRYSESVNEGVVTRNLSKLYYSNKIEGEYKALGTLTGNLLVVNDDVVNGEVKISTTSYVNNEVDRVENLILTIAEALNNKQVKESNIKYTWEILSSYSLDSLVSCVKIKSSGAEYVTNYEEVTDGETTIGDLLKSIELKNSLSYSSDFDLEEDVDLYSYEEYAIPYEKYIKYSESLYDGANDAFGSKLGCYEIGESKYYDGYTVFSTLKNQKYVQVDSDNFYILNNITYVGEDYERITFDSSDDDIIRKDIMLVETSKPHQDISSYDVYAFIRGHQEASIIETVTNGERKYTINGETRNYITGLITENTANYTKYDFNKDYELDYYHNYLEAEITANRISLTSSYNTLYYIGSTTYRDGFKLGDVTYDENPRLLHYILSANRRTGDNYSVIFDIDLFEAFYHFDYSTIDELADNLVERFNMVVEKWSTPYQPLEDGKFIDKYYAFADYYGFGKIARSRDLYVKWNGFSYYGLFECKSNETIGSISILHIEFNDLLSLTNGAVVDYTRYNLEDSEKVIIDENKVKKTFKELYAYTYHVEWLEKVTYNTKMYYVDSSVDNLTIEYAQSLTNPVCDFDGVEFNATWYVGENGKYGVDFDIMTYLLYSQENIVETYQCKDFAYVNEYIENGQILPLKATGSIVYQDGLLTYNIGGYFNTNKNLYSLDEKVREREIHDKYLNASIGGKIGMENDKFVAKLILSDNCGLLKKYIAFLEKEFGVPATNYLTTIRYTEGENVIFDISVDANDERFAIDANVLNGIVYGAFAVDKQVNGNDTQYLITVSYSTDIVFAGVDYVNENNKLEFRTLVGFTTDENGNNKYYVRPYYILSSINGYYFELSVNDENQSFAMFVTTPTDELNVEFVDGNFSAKFDIEFLEAIGGLNFDTKSELPLNPVESIFGVIEEDIRYIEFRRTN